MKENRAGLPALLLICCAALPLGSCGDGDDGVRPPTDSDLVLLLEPLLEAELSGAARNLGLPDGPGGCLEISPLPWQDADGDGVPDDATFTFDEAGCAFTVPGGGGGTRSGVVRVTDPGAPFGYEAVLTNDLSRFTGGRPPVTVTRTTSGTQSVTGSPTAATMVRDVTITTGRTGLPTATAVQQLTAQYTPIAPGEILFGVGTPLPPGTMTLTGQIAWSVPGRDLELAITTPTPLLHGACDLGGPESGEVRVRVLSGAATGYLAITYVGCEPQLQWHPD